MSKNLTNRNTKTHKQLSSFRVENKGSLTNTHRKQIINIYKQGLGMRPIAKMFGVNRNVVKRIVREVD